MKQKIRLTENELKQIVAESVKNILKERYDDNGFNSISRVHKDTRTRFNPQGYDWEGYNEEGYNKDGWSKEGINKFTKSKYDKAGYDKDGFNKFGINQHGRKRDGRDFLGYDEEGYDKKGYDKNGWNKRGINKITKSKYDKAGYDKDGYDEFGLDKQSKGKYRFIELIRKCSNIKNVLYNINYDKEGLGAYNNNNLLNIPDLAYWLDYAVDRFAAVTKNGDVYTDYNPNVPVGNIFTDTLYFCMDNGKDKEPFFGGEEAAMFMDKNGMYTLITSYDGVFKGRVKRYDKRLHTFLIEERITY